MPTFLKEERLKSRKQIENLVKQGEIIYSQPLKLIWQKKETTYKNKHREIKVAFSVPKRRFKKAVDRNRIKRILREAYRHEKSVLWEKNCSGKSLLLLFVYVGNKIISYKEASEKMKEIIRQISLKDKKNDNKPNE